MYYITNHNNQIIAADENLLKSLNVENIDTLIKEILLEKILFSNKSSNEVQITTADTTLSYTTTHSDLSSMLGNLNLIHLENVEEAPLLDTKEDEALSDLTLPTVATHTIDEISLDEDTTTHSDTLDTSPIIININKISEEIGISNEDYKTFLNDYIDTAISLEDELKSHDENERLSAMGTLTQLADVLQLPKVNPIIEKISTVPQDELPGLVDSFYQTLARLTTEEDSNTHAEASTEILPSVLPNIEETVTIEPKKELYPTRVEGGFGKIYLEDVKPIYFDFQLEAAANDLSLPVELIEEFVHDFIDQGHIETKKMLQAYEEGDLDTIQKIGHLLKGASSNLRINALSDTLYDIQFCEDPDKLEDLIERYWAHFISFEQQINMITKD